MKKVLCAILLFGICLSLYSATLEETISAEDGLVEYYVWMDMRYHDPANYDWSVGVDESGDKYVLAVEKNYTFPNYYYFYLLDESSLDEEYNYFAGYALGLLRDTDKETTGSIGDDYIFTKTANTDRRTYPYGEYIGNKFHFIPMQKIPYTKFNLVWESGAMVMDF